MLNILIYILVMGYKNYLSMKVRRNGNFKIKHDLEENRILTCHGEY